MADLSSDVLKNNLTSAAKRFLWEVVFPSIPGGGDARSLEIRCQSSALPGAGTTPITIPFKGTPGIVVPGKNTVSHTWPLTFVESTEDRKTFDAIYGWRQVIQHDRLGTGGPDPTVKVDPSFRALDQAGNTWLTIKLTGCWPQDVSEVGMSYEDNSVLLLPVTLAFDRWERVD